MKSLWLKYSYFDWELNIYLLHSFSYLFLHVCISGIVYIQYWNVNEYFIFTLNQNSCKESKKILINVWRSNNHICNINCDKEYWKLIDILLEKSQMKILNEVGATTLIFCPCFFLLVFVPFPTIEGFSSRKLSLL